MNILIFSVGESKKYGIKSRILKVVRTKNKNIFEKTYKQTKTNVT